MRISDWSSDVCSSDLELARSVVAGLCIFPAGTHHAAKLVSAAKVTVAKAFDFIGKQSIQLHGGIGLTDEYELSHHYKRGLALQEMYGNKREHALRLAKQIGRAHV